MIHCNYTIRRLQALQYSKLTATCHLSQRPRAGPLVVEPRRRPQPAQQGHGRHGPGRVQARQEEGRQGAGGEFLRERKREMSVLHG